MYALLRPEKYSFNDNDQKLERRCPYQQRKVVNRTMHGFTGPRPRPGLLGRAARQSCRACARTLISGEM